MLFFFESAPAHFSLPLTKNIDIFMAKNIANINIDIIDISAQNIAKELKRVVHSLVRSFY